MMELFKEHPIHKGYMIGNKGTVNGSRRDNIGSTKSDGYRYVWINGQWQYIHRLVYETFVGVIAANLEINHLDGNRGNNELSNLQATTHSDNVQHSYTVLKRKTVTG